MNTYSIAQGADWGERAGSYTKRFKHTNSTVCKPKRQTCEKSQKSDFIILCHGNTSPDGSVEPQKKFQEHLDPVTGTKLHGVRKDVRIIAKHSTTWSAQHVNQKELLQNAEKCYSFKSTTKYCCLLASLPVQDDVQHCPKGLQGVSRRTMT